MIITELVLLAIATIIIISVYIYLNVSNKSKRNAFFSSLIEADKSYKDIVSDNVFKESMFNTYSVSLPYRYKTTIICDYSCLISSGSMALNLKGSFYTEKISDNESFLYIVIKGTPEKFVNDKLFGYLDVYDCVTDPMYHVHIYYKGENKPSCELIKKLLAISYKHKLNILVNNGYLTIYEKPGFKNHYANDINYRKTSLIGSKIHNVIDNT